MILRTLSASDIPAATLLSGLAGWNQTPRDWRNLLHLAPDGSFGIESDGLLVATATAVCFAPEVAWIGMVLTHPDWRGRGFARRLTEHALEYLSGRKIEWIKLDASDLGRPLYKKLGFEDEGPIERWMRSPGPIGCEPRPEPKPGPLPPLDREAFGADRSSLLNVLRSFEFTTLDSAYAMGRPGAKAAYFGPCVSSSPESARDLLCWFLSRHPEESVFWDLLPSNTEALKFARNFGFERARELVRMVRRGSPDARPLVHNDSYTFAIAGFEYG